MGVSPESIKLDKFAVAGGPVLITMCHLMASLNGGEAIRGVVNVLNKLITRGKDGVWLLSLDSCDDRANTGVLDRIVGALQPYSRTGRPGSYPDFGRNGSKSVLFYWSPQSVC